MVYGTSLALVVDVLPGARRGLAVGIVIMSAGVASFLGVAFSMYAVEQLSWRWAFWIQVPLALAAPAATSRLPVRASAESALRVLRRIDWRGGLLLFGALTVATLSFDHVHEGEQSFQAGAHYHLPMHALALVVLLAFAGVLESLVVDAAAADLADAYLRGFERSSLAMAALAGLAVLAIFWSQRRPSQGASDALR
jgi:MFS family permease